MNNKVIPWPRRLGETVASLEMEEKPNKGFLREIQQNLQEVLEALPEHEHQTAKLAWIIARVRKASNTEEVSRFLVEGMKLRKVVTLDEEETEKARRNADQRKLLVYVGRDVWAPKDFENKSHQALIIAARQTMGRLKRKVEKD